MSTTSLRAVFPNLKLKVSPVFLENVNVIKLPVNLILFPLYNQINATYSPVKPPQGEMNQQDADLSSLKQEIYTKHQSEVIVLRDWRESCRRLLNKTFLDSPL